MTRPFLYAAALTSTGITFGTALVGLEWQALGCVSVVLAILAAGAQSSARNDEPDYPAAGHPEAWLPTEAFPLPAQRGRHG